MTAMNATHAPDTPAPVLAGVYETAAADPAVRVQDDLFRHVNGGWLRDAEIPAEVATSPASTRARAAPAGSRSSSEGTSSKWRMVSPPRR